MTGDIRCNQRFWKFPLDWANKTGKELGQKQVAEWAGMISLHNGRDLFSFDLKMLSQPKRIVEG